MRLGHRRVMWVGLVALLAACSGAPRTSPTLEGSLAHAQAQVGAAYQTVADLATRGRITKERGRALIREIDAADLSVKLARTASNAGDLAGARGKLEAATALLLRLESSLKEPAP